jgi:hypothetical protein
VRDNEGVAGAGEPGAATAGVAHRWTIRPEPTEDELAALVVAVTTLMPKSPFAGPTGAEPPSRWSQAGRWAAHHRWREPFSRDPPPATRHPRGGAVNR